MLGVAIALALRSLARRPADPDGRAAAGSAWIGPRVRAWYRGALEPAETWLAASGWSPDALTYAQLVLSVLAGWAYATAAVFLAGCLVLTAGTLDILDGGLARRCGIAGPRGALVDSVADRWAEFATFVGLGVLYRDGWMLGVVALAAFGSQMVSYVRARAEALGVAMATGRAQRPERYLLLGGASVLAGLVGHLTCPGGRPGYGVLSLSLVVLAGVSVWTAVERGRRAAAALRGSEGK
ncbi:MAG TPA: CDP-alcohol phosphatidyltransferase family protein [Candidatus Limnocylindria bacterium]|nr:CDP-alcohol phosphatidyltransferase family protein [Candidatus Limnocylindria bacterium]